MIITIDGPASSGKSTVADIISKKLNILHFNSGALFRGVTAHLINIGYDITSITTYSDIPTINIKIEIIDNSQHVIVNNIDYTPRLRDNEISKLVASVSLNKKVRTLIDKCEREFAKENSIIIEGRDTGSHVFPNAEYKFYLDCSIEERSRRRYEEEKIKNQNISLEEIKNQLIERDNIDRTRKIAPLVIPKDAIIIDSSNLSIDEVTKKILSHIK